jgi:hypothetical protein
MKTPNSLGKRLPWWYRYFKEVESSMMRILIIIWKMKKKIVKSLRTDPNKICTLPPVEYSKGSTESVRTRNDSPGSVEGIGPVINQEDNMDPSTEPKPEQACRLGSRQGFFERNSFYQKITKTYGIFQRQWRTLARHPMPAVLYR